MNIFGLILGTFLEGQNHDFFFGIKNCYMLIFEICGRALSKNKDKICMFNCVLGKNLIIFWRVFLVIWKILLKWHVMTCNCNETTSPHSFWITEDSVKMYCIHPYLLKFSQDSWCSSPKRIKHTNIWKKQTKTKLQFTQRIFELAPDTFQHHQLESVQREQLKTPIRTLVSQKQMV